MVGLPPFFCALAFFVFSFRLKSLYWPYQPTATKTGNTTMDNKKKLRQIAERQGFKVTHGANFCFLFLGSKIILARKRGPKVTEWCFLHELGHAELCKKRERNHLLTLYRMLRMPKYKPTPAFFRDYLRMEWKAWEQGFKIAQREGIRIDEKGYWRHANKCYKTYVDNLEKVYED